ncbi:bacteriocin [Escherichia coli]|nr:bacteriocin [Escherichia coli]
MDYFPDSKKSVMYRNGKKIIFLPMRVSDIMGNDKLLDELRVRASC